MGKRENMYIHITFKLYTKLKLDRILQVDIYSLHHLQIHSLYNKACDHVMYWFYHPISTVTTICEGLPMRLLHSNGRVHNANLIIILTYGNMYKQFLATNSQ